MPAAWKPHSSGIGLERDLGREAARGEEHIEKEDKHSRSSHQVGVAGALRGLQTGSSVGIGLWVMVEEGRGGA